MFLLIRKCEWFRTRGFSGDMMMFLFFLSSKTTFHFFTFSLSLDKEYDFNLLPKILKITFKYEMIIGNPQFRPI